MLEVDIISKWNDQTYKRYYRLIIGDTIFNVDQETIEMLKEKCEQALPDKNDGDDD